MEIRESVYLYLTILKARCQINSAVERIKVPQWRSDIIITLNAQSTVFTGLESLDHCGYGFESCSRNGHTSSIF